MKKLYYSLFINLVLLFQITNGGLTKGIFGTIHETAHKIHDDIHKVFHPNEDTNKRGLYPEVNNIKYKETEDRVFTFAVSSTRTPQVMSNVTPTKTEKITEERPFVFVTSSTPGPDTVQVTTTKSATTTVKDGRENFAGGCLPGRQRTDDGRCEVPF